MSDRLYEKKKTTVPAQIIRQARWHHQKKKNSPLPMTCTFKVCKQRARKLKLDKSKKEIKKKSRKMDKNAASTIVSFVKIPSKSYFR